MNIYITEREYRAICAILDQVCTDAEAASDEDYLAYIETQIAYTRRLLKKYQQKRNKSNQ